MKLPKPIWDRVVIRPIDDARLSIGGFGLHVPEVARKKPNRGEVMAVGPGVYTGKGHLVEAGVEVGDVVMYSRYPISGVEYEGYLIMRPIDILGVFKNGG